MKRAAAFLLCVLMLFSLSGCGDGGYKTNMSFTAVLPTDISTLDPQIASSAASSLVIDSIFEGLCRINEDGDATPGVAERWDSSGDSTVFTFHLRSGAKWSNGDPVTADDFLFAILRALRPETGTPSVDDLFIIKNARAIHSGEAEESTLGVRAEDDRTLVVELEKSYPDFPALTAGDHYMPCNREYFEASSGHYGLSSEYLITNGPFTFQNIYSWKTDYNSRYVALYRSDNYRGAYKPAPEELTYLIDYKDVIDSSPIQALLDGETDILSLPETTARSAAEQGCGVLALNDAVTGLLLNPRAEKLSYIATRELFIKTLDRQDVLSRRDTTKSKEALGIMPECIHWDGESYYADGTALYAEQDDSVTESIPSLIKLLEVEKVPSITVLCPDDEESINVANGLLVSWNNKLGNAFNIEPVTDSEFQRRIANGDYEAALYTLRAGGTTPYDVLKAFESTAYPTLLEDNAYDDSLHSLTFDLASYRELEGVLRDNYVFYPLFSDTTYYATNPSVRNIKVTPDQSIDFTDARKKP